MNTSVPGITVIWAASGLLVNEAVRKPKGDRGDGAVGEGEHEQFGVGRGASRTPGR